MAALTENQQFSRPLDSQRLILSSTLSNEVGVSMYCNYIDRKEACDPKEVYEAEEPLECCESRQLTMAQRDESSESPQ